MERRAFLGILVGGVATAAAVRSWPFRVYSFPAKVEVMTTWNLVALEKGLNQGWIRIGEVRDLVFTKRLNACAVPAELFFRSRATGWVRSSGVELNDCRAGILPGRNPRVLATRASHTPEYEDRSSHCVRS